MMAPERSRAWRLVMARTPTPTSSRVVPSRIPAVVSDYWAMTKPDVNSLIAITTAAAFYLGSPGGLADFPWIRSCIPSSARCSSPAVPPRSISGWSADSTRRCGVPLDARSPLAASNRVGALMFGTLLSVAGAAHILLLPSDVWRHCWLLVTLLSYLLLYTPLKRVTPLCTFIGAIPGAMPPLIGWAAARGHLDPEAWMLYAIVFLWQFPHFMAIAWMYRDDYDRAGYLVLPRGHARVRVVTCKRCCPSWLFSALSLFPVLSGEPSVLYVIGAAVGLCFLVWRAVRRRRSGSAARQLLLASILYLPSLLVLMILNASR